MPTSWAEVASDAVKIGLGAVIGGMFAIIAAKQAHGIRLNEEYSKRRRDQLEKISELFDAVSRAANDHIAALHAADSVKGSKIKREAIAESLGAEVENFGNIVDQLHSIEARLALLALHNVSEEVEKFRHAFTHTNHEGLEKRVPSDWKDSSADFLSKQRTIIVTHMALAYRES